MPSYTSIYRTLRKLADQETAATQSHGQNSADWGIIRLDNVQQYIRQRDPRVGRENIMQIGIAATYFEIPRDLFIEGAADLADKRRRITENKRKDLTMQQVLGWVDNTHLEKVGVLHWLKVLMDYIPELDIYREHVSILFRTRVRKHQIPVHKTTVHPLATSGKNETVIGELKDAVLDFLSQIGQTKENHFNRLMLIGGDGLTYEKLLLLKKYLQLHDDPFESFELLLPQLEEWHTESTNMNRIYERHWGSSLSCDPSTLGHSARKIGRPEPANKKKVDFYPSTQLLFLVCDVRMLDCWRYGHAYRYFVTTDLRNRLAFKQQDIFTYFESLGKAGQLPPFEDLEKVALELYRAYTSSRGQY
jgi:hypothetical protein